MPNGLVTRRELASLYRIHWNTVDKWIRKRGIQPVEKRSLGSGAHTHLFRLSDVVGVRHRRVGYAQIRPVTDESWARLCKVLDDVAAGRCWPKRHWEVFEHSQRQSPRDRLDKAV